MFADIAMCGPEAVAGISRAIRTAITDYKRDRGENNGAFWLSVSYDTEYRHFVAKCDFSEYCDCSMINVHYAGDGNSKIVDRLFGIDADYSDASDEILSDIAYLFLGNEWVD